MTRSVFGALGVAFVVIAFLGVNLFVSRIFGRAQLDLTEDSLYTISSSTRSLLADLEEPITVRLFVSRDLIDLAPGLAPYIGRVEALLRDYEALAPEGRLDVQRIDLEPDTDEEDRAQGFGLQGTPIEGGVTLYLGIVATNSVDGTEVLSLDPSREAFLEYDLTRIVDTLARPKRRVVAVLDGIGMMGAGQMAALTGGGGQPWLVAEAMRRLYDVRVLTGAEPELPADADLLMLVHPKELAPGFAYLIDQWALSGKPVLAFVDPHAESTPRQGFMPPEDTGSDLPALFPAWGVSFDPAQVLADSEGAAPVAAQDSGGRPVQAPYYAFLQLARPPEGRATFADSPVVAQLQVVNVLSAGTLSGLTAATTRFEPLIQSGPSASTIQAASVRFFPNALEIARQWQPGSQPLTLAARVAGPIETAFPDGRPADPTPGAVSPPAAPEAVRSGTLNAIVVADVDLLSDSTWARVSAFLGARGAVAFANNADFVLNAIDALAGGAALLDLRGRGVSNRPFTLIQDLERAAQAAFQARADQLDRERQETERRLTELQRARSDDGEAAGALLTPEQQAEITQFRDKVADIRRELRGVRREMREDIERTETLIIGLNLAVVPILVALFAFGLALWRGAQAARAARSARTTPAPAG